MKPIFYLEDHHFFADIIIRNLKQLGYDVLYCDNYYEAEKVIEKNGPFEFSILDVMLKNGKNGINFVEKYHDKLGNFIFLTGCKDEATIRTINNREYPSISKMYEIVDDLIDFIEKGKRPIISMTEVC
jgi:response regulator RpfG family c-di-GMP phosphodiesterase